MQEVHQLLQQQTQLTLVNTEKCIASIDLTSTLIGHPHNISLLGFRPWKSNSTLLQCLKISPDVCLWLELLNVILYLIFPSKKWTGIAQNHLSGWLSTVYIYWDHKCLPFLSGPALIQWYTCDMEPARAVIIVITGARGSLTMPLVVSTSWF